MITRVGAAETQSLKIPGFTAAINQLKIHHYHISYVVTPHTCRTADLAMSDQVQLQLRNLHTNFETLSQLLNSKHIILKRSQNTVLLT